MVEVYKYIPDFSAGKLLLANDSYFNAHVAPMDIDELGMHVMKKIDGAVILDRHTGAIQTAFGVCSIDNLSTGCKTVLNYRYVCKNKIDLYIDASECGANALELLLSEVESFHRPIILRHSDRVFKCSSRNYRVYISPSEVVEGSESIILSY